MVLPDVSVGLTEEFMVAIELIFDRILRRPPFDESVALVVMMEIDPVPPWARWRPGLIVVQ
jgi:hypothetical protein